MEQYFISEIGPCKMNTVLALLIGGLKNVYIWVLIWGCIYELHR